MLAVGKLVETATYRQEIGVSEKVETVA